MIDGYVPLVEVTRGDIVESVHFGAFAVVDSQGNLIESKGNPEMITYPRSSMKPLQVLPLIELGGDLAYNLTAQEIAIMCASHAGTELHRSTLEEMHQKIGISENDLACGVHWPGDSATSDAMKTNGETPTPFRHNCSGKHTGMLAHACLRGLDKSDYLDPQHPVQVTIRQTLAEMIGMDPNSLPLGIDGCSAPVYGMPLYNMAWAVAKMADPCEMTRKRSEACQRITSAMIAHPEMVAGPGKFDTELMRVAGEKVFCKGGAEGYQIIGVKPGVIAHNTPGMGIAIKISDGDPSGRARTSVTLSILFDMGILKQDDIMCLADFGNKPVKNWREIIVGEIRPAFTVNGLGS